MGIIERKKRLMMMEKSLLPSAYRQVEWLRSSGTQYIDTGYKPTTNTTIDITFKYNGSVSNEDRNPFGVRHSNNSSDRGWVIWTNITSTKGVAVHYPITTSNRTDTGWIFKGNFTTEPVHLLITPDYIKANGSTVYTFNVTRTSFASSYSAWLFAARAGSSSTIRTKDDYSIYGLTLSEGSTVYRNFVPCVRISDSKPGMYDTVNDQFYVNNGTGDFLVPA